MKKFLVFLLLIFVDTSYAETVTWYKDGTVYDTTTCQTGDDITVPSAPTKRGYVFNGWVFAYDFSTLDASVAGTSYTSSNMTWTTIFPYGRMSGTALCSAKVGTYAVAGTPDEAANEGKYCWCKATGFVPSGSNIRYENTTSSAWVFYSGYNSASDCMSACAHACSFYVMSNAQLRQAVFGITQ